jgi:hypothetical protein
MFANAIITSAKFLRMPATSRLLYYDLGMAADDDGCVEAFSVMRMTGATEDDLRVLASKGFVKVLNADLVSYILDWNTNNQIRKDRYVEGMYKHLIDTACTVLLQDGDEMTTICQPNGNQMTPQYSKGKLSTVESSTGEDKGEAAPPKPSRHKYGLYKNVLLSDEEYQKLQEEFPHDYTDRIERLSEYIASTGKRYKSHLATIRSWARKDTETKPSGKQRNGNVFLEIAQEEGLV